MRVKMNERLFCYLGLLLIFCSGINSYSQERELLYDHFNISNGLISDNVYKILIDREGHVWIVTANGLQKYNGYEFETYTFSSANEGSLSSNFVEDIFEDRKGDLIVVLDDGIDVFNRLTNRFTNLISDIPYIDIRRNEISRLASAVQDRSGSIWVNCNNQLVRINSDKTDFLIYQDDLKGRFVLNSDSTALWIISDRSIKKYDLESEILVVRDIGDIPGSGSINRLNAIYFDSDHNCWLGTSSGLYLFDDESFRILLPESVIPDLSDTPGVIQEKNITAIFEDFQKNLWIASGSMLFRMDRSSGKIQILQHDIENSNSILGEQITGIHGNQSGIIWITYLNEGFTRINIRTSNFNSYRIRSDRKNSLGGKTVRSVFKDDKGFIWLGLYNDGLDRIDPVSGSISHFRNDPDDYRSISSNYISSLFLDDKQRLWVGSHDNGLCYSDNAYEEKLSFKIPGYLNGNDEIYHIQDDSLGRIWFGTRTGLGMFDYDQNIFQWVLTNYNVQSLSIDQNTIWIASWDHGLCKLCFTMDQFNSRLPQFDSVTSYNYGTLNAQGEDDYMSSVVAGGLRNGISVYLDQDKNIWLGTYEWGLLRVIETGNELTYKIYDVSKGAPGNAVYGVTGDNQGNIWISTEHGIGKFDPLTEEFENYSREDGLLSNYFMWKSYFKSADGEILFGSVDGLNTFYPENVLRDTLIPRVLFSEFRVQNQLVECGDTVEGDVILDKHITYQDTLVLNHRNRIFSFRYYTTGSVHSKRMKFSHMLVGFDEDWIENEGGNRSTSYNNLSPGTYFFRVRAIDNKTEWSGIYEEKMLVILPPWWKTRLLYVVYLLVILGLIFLITYSLVRFLKLKEELIYNEKLHQAKLMFFTNISHEFKTPLSLIKAPLNEILNEKQLSPYNRKNLAVARQNADNLLNLVNELMEFRRTDAGISKLRCEKVNLTSFVNEIAIQFECMAEEKGIHFYFNIPDEQVKLWVDREKFRKITYNLLENAMKYTSDDGQVTLSIIRNPIQFRFKSDYHTFNMTRVKKNLEYIGILVSDSGVGISRGSLPRIFDRFYQIDAERAGQHIGSGIGLALVKNLVLMHQGEIRVASERGVGSEILVLLPLGDTHLGVDEKISTMDKPISGEVAGIWKGAGIPGIIKNDLMDKAPGLPLIMLVEDNEEFRQYLAEHLADEYQILEAANGAEGLEILKDHRPDLIITDWIMPVMDGADFIKEIRSEKSTSTIPVVLLTARDELKDLQDGLDMGADQVITKPFNLQLLRSQLKRIIANNRSRMKRYSLQNMENLANVNGEREAQFMVQVEHIVKEHIMDTGLNAAMIARLLGVSRTTLYDRIRLLTGQTISECIQRIRLKHAIKLMLYERIPLSEVYVMVGFSSSSYMIRIFKKYYQTTPMEYVRNYLKTASN
jgi:signal transduction histidine kinase/ligand-binding sensor domain-containing protein/DNA-binding NarL/FixJ family response regulator